MPIGTWPFNNDPPRNADDVLLEELAAPTPMRKWRIQVAYRTPQRRYRNKTVFGEAPSRAHAIQGVEAAWAGVDGFYIYGVTDITDQPQGD